MKRKNDSLRKGLEKILNFKDKIPFPTMRYIVVPPHMVEWAEKKFNPKEVEMSYIWNDTAAQELKATGHTRRCVNCGRELKSKISESGKGFVYCKECYIKYAGSLDKKCTRLEWDELL